MIEKVLQLLLPNIFGEEMQSYRGIDKYPIQASSKAVRNVKTAEGDVECSEITVIESGKITITRKIRGNIKSLGVEL